MRNNQLAITIVIVLTVGVLALVSCRKQDGDDGKFAWNAKRPQTMQETFSHEVHKPVLSKEGFECFVCHPMEVELDDEAEMEALIRASTETFFPGKETCHFCHYNPQAGNIAPDNCGSCHFNVREIQPANHNFDWTSRHVVFSKADVRDCETCHSPRFCEGCHEQRDVTVRRVHDRNFRFVHAIEARANPSQCGSCHKLKSFCDKCHIEGGYER